MMIIGSNPRNEAPVLNARIRKRWLRGNFLIGVVGQKADLTWPLRLSRRRARNPRRTSPTIRPRSKAEADVHPRRRALRAARRRGGAVAGGQGRAGARPRQRRLERLQRAAHGGGRVGGLDLGFVPGQGGLDALAMAQGRRARSALQSRRRRDRRSSRAPSSSTSARTAIAARIAPTSSCRAPPIPRRPASTSTPRAGRNSPSAPCSRRAKPARTGRSCARSRSALGAQAAVRHPRRSCAPRSTRRIRISSTRRRSRRPIPPRSAAIAGAASRRRGVRLADAGFLPDQPDRPRLAGDGRMFGPGERAARDAAE